MTSLVIWYAVYTIITSPRPGTNGVTIIRAKLKMSETIFLKLSHQAQRALLSVSAVETAMCLASLRILLSFCW
ncbi:hypothetical protein D3C78_1949560 [compost metagenome]